MFLHLCVHMHVPSPPMSCPQNSYVYFTVAADMLHVSCNREIDASPFRLLLNNPRTTSAVHHNALV